MEIHFFHQLIDQSQPLGLLFSLPLNPCMKFVGY